jgi:2'-hydroxyisoflavone reductase
MDLLILGGTVFLGRALVEAARARGHRLTLFNRGRTAPALYADLEQIHGDRATDLSLLNPASRRWDAVIDTCGYLPQVVRTSANLLAGAAASYTFISTLSVYADTRLPGLDEHGALAQLPPGAAQQVTGDTYGPLKALCEQAIQQEMPGRALILRPGLIVGPNDPTDRFSYWPWRIAQGGEVLAPGRPELPIQWIDVRDLAEFTIRLVEARQTGVFNAVGPLQPASFGQLLETCRVESSSDAFFTWIDEETLLSSGVAPWTELPLWIPENDPSAAGFSAFSNRKAAAAGLNLRPLRETVQATLSWLSERPTAKPWRAGLTGEREAQLLRDLPKRALS